MGVMPPYPKIPFTPEEVTRDEDLKRIGRAYQAEMDRQDNPCALKGGTALRLKIGLPRPSTDLDFEGDAPVNLRKSVRNAIEQAGLTNNYRVGVNWGWRGTVRIRPARTGLAGSGPTRLDYRRTGTRPNMPERVPLDKCERVDGILIYNDDELIRRKLATVVGDKPRWKARDIYDAGWIVTEHADLIGVQERRALKKWMASTTRAAVNQIKDRMRRDSVIRRVEADEVWSRLRDGVRLLPQRC